MSVIISPTAGSNITMYFPEDISGSSTYLVDARNSDLGESKRMSRLYQDRFWHTREKSDTVPLKLRVYVIADTQADNVSALQDLNAALTAPIGGRVTYTAPGLTARFLRYHKSSPANLREKAVALNSLRMGEWSFDWEGQKFVSVIELEIDTEPPFLSGTDARESLVTETAIRSVDDASYNNYVSLESTAFDADAILPTLIVHESAGSDHFGGVLVHIFPRAAALSAPQIRPIECESFTFGGDWSSSADAACSGGNKLTTSVASPADIYEASFSYVWFDQTSGKVVPVIVARAVVGETWTIRPWIGQETTGGTVVNKQYANAYEFTPARDSWYLLHNFESLDFPPYMMSEYMKEDIDTHHWVFGIEVERTSGSGALQLDFVYLFPTTNCWIAYMYTDHEDGRLFANDDLFVDCISKLAFVRDTSTDHFYDRWSKKGMPYAAMVLAAGYDYEFHFLATNYADGAMTQLSQFSVQVRGVHAGAMPF